MSLSSHKQKADISEISFHEVAQIENYGISVLSGLESVDPGFLFPTGEVNKVGSLTESDLQTQVMTALQKAGIKVLEHHQGDSVATLVITVEATETCPSLEGFKTRIDLYQDVKLIRDPEIHTRTQTWSTICQKRVIKDSNRVEQVIKDEVLAQLNEFVNDYLAANPKPFGMVKDGQ